ncbi:TPA: OmpH family outer membrane protein [Candidatus Scatousia excrementigallinarum]|uniref:OmpH family outer membrane protein n=1 Tax=Candidatus Scatousia excrementigallinarum TaxID=2840935 RepID=A0A9D1EZA9_9BACT|nr:OmpH family outer membrane protein [Candidatus Scatousia excrementigallinarum]
MKKFGMVALGLAAFVVGMSVNNFAMSDVPPSYKVAVVDVSKVVASSAQVKALKKEQQTKATEIVKYVEKARKDVAAVSDEKKKKALEDKYSKELMAKRDKLEKEYTSKLTAIDANISKTIETQAKAKNYNIVLAKGVVLYGGDDITAEVIKVVK